MPTPEKVRLGEILIQERLLNQEQLHFALEQQMRNGRKFGHAVLGSKFVTKEQVFHALSQQLGAPYFDLKFFDARPKLVRIRPMAER